MSLDILSDLDKWREVAYDRVSADGEEPRYRLRVEAHAYIVIASPSIGLDVLDESTAEKWLLRMRVMETVYGPWTYRQPEEGEGDQLIGVPVTMDALRPFFGTRTNAFPAVSDAKFERHVGKALMSETRSRMEREAREAAKAQEAVTVS